MREPAAALYDLAFADDEARFRAGGGSPLDPGLAPGASAAATRALAMNPDAESRLRILAFRRLAGRPAAGDDPPVPLPSPPPLLGVVVEIGLDEGPDLLAAYADGRVRYLNHAGPVAVVEGDPTFRPAVDALLAAAAPVATAIGPWEGPRRPPPRAGVLRLTFLVGPEIRFGEGPIDVLSRDPMGGPVFAAATRLLRAVTDRAQPR